MHSAWMLLLTCLVFIGESQAQPGGGPGFIQAPTCIQGISAGTEIFAGQTTTRWGWDLQANPDPDCVAFEFGGANGNDNNFFSRQECLDACGPDDTIDSFRIRPRNTCDLPRDVGPCRAAIRRWYYDEDDNKCRSFTYGGCRGNANNFESKDECEDECQEDGLSTTVIIIICIVIPLVVIIIICVVVWICCCLGCCRCQGWDDAGPSFLSRGPGNVRVANVY